jgi:hypothetical protein
LLKEIKQLVNLLLLIILCRFLSHRPHRFFLFLLLELLTFLLYFLLVLVRSIQSSQVVKIEFSSLLYRNFILKHTQYLRGGLIVLFFHFFGPFSIRLCLLSNLFKLFFLFALLLLYICLGVVNFFLELVEPLFMFEQNWGFFICIGEAVRVG